MSRFLRLLFVTGLAYPVTLFWLGLTVFHRERLPKKGPAILVANHNSHLDILVLLALFPFARALTVRPAAAADYFLRSRLLAWFALRMVGIVPVERQKVSRDTDPLAGCHQVLAEENILVLFPEGTRGEPEQLSAVKSGVWHLARRHPGVPVIPVYLHGLGRSMGRGRLIPVPFFVDVLVGEPLPWDENRARFKETLQNRFSTMKARLDGQPADWKTN